MRDQTRIPNLRGAIGGTTQTLLSRLLDQWSGRGGSRTAPASAAQNSGNKARMYMKTKDNVKKSCSRGAKGVAVSRLALGAISRLRDQCSGRGSSRTAPYVGNTKFDERSGNVYENKGQGQKVEKSRNQMVGSGSRTSPTSAARNRENKARMSMKRKRNDKMSLSPGHAFHASARKV
jgi:hypothetical protein